MTGKKFKTVEEYIASFPEDVQEVLEACRAAIKEAAPGAEEIVSYNIAAFRLNGLLVWYAAFKNHIGLYPRPSTIRAFEHDLVGYKTSKGAIQFPLNKKIPLRLIKKIVKYRVRENKKKF